MTPSLPSSIGSLVTSLSSSGSKRTDWTTSKTASLSRVNDIRRKEIDARRRPLSRSLQSSSSRTRSLTPNNNGQRLYHRINSDGQTYGHVNSNGQFLYSARDMHSRQDRGFHRGRSQSADLVAMRAGYHEMCHHQPFVKHHSDGYVNSSHMSPRANVHMYQGKSYPSSFYRSNSRDGYQANAFHNIAALMNYNRSHYPTSLGARDTSSTVALGSQTGSSLASGLNVAVNGDFHSSDGNLSGSYAPPKSNVVISPGSTCTSDRMKQKMERIETVKRQAKHRVDTRRASIGNSSVDLDCNKNTSRLSPGSSSNVSVSARTTKTVGSTPKSITARTVKSAPPAPPRRNSAQADWLSKVRSRGETNRNNNAIGDTSSNQGADSDSFGDINKPIDRVYSSGNKPAATSGVSPLREQGALPSVVDSRPPPPIEHERPNDDGTVLSAASSFIQANMRMHSEQKEDKAVESLDSKIVNDKKKVALDKSVASKSTDSKTSADSTVDEISTGVAKSIASKVSASSFKDRSKVKMNRHVSFTDENNYIYAKPVIRASSPNDENGSGSTDAPGWRMPLSSSPDADIDNGSTESPGRCQAELNVRADPPASLPEDLSRVFDKRRSHHKHRSSDDSDATIKSKCYTSSNFEEMMIREASVCSSSLGSLALSKNDSSCNAGTRERKGRDDSFALEHLWDEDEGMSIDVSLMQSANGNNSSSQHQETKIVSATEVDQKGVAKNITSARLHEVKKLCKQVNSDIMHSACSVSDTETLPTVDTSTTPDSFLTLNQRKADSGCREVKQLPGDKADYRIEHGIPQGRKCQSLLLPRHPTHQAPPPRYNRSRSLEYNPSQNSSSQRSGTYVRRSQNVERPIGNVVNSYQRLHMQAQSLREQSRTAQLLNRHHSKLQSGGAQHTPSPPKRHAPPPPPPRQTQSETNIHMTPSKGRVAPPPPPPRSRYMSRCQSSIL